MKRVGKKSIEDLLKFIDDHLDLGDVTYGLRADTGPKGMVFRAVAERPGVTFPYTLDLVGWPESNQDGHEDEVADELEEEFDYWGAMLYAASFETGAVISPRVLVQVALHANSTALGRI